jgi:hypothetical protein
VEVRGFAPISIFKEFVLFFFGWVRYLIFFIVVNIFLGKKFFPQKILTTIEGIWNPFAQSNFWFANLNWTPLVFLKPSSQVNNFTVFFHFFMGMSKSVFSICLG